MESCSSAKGKLEVRSSSDEVVIDADARGGCTTYESDDAAAPVAVVLDGDAARFVHREDRAVLVQYAGLRSARHALVHVAEDSDHALPPH